MYEYTSEQIHYENIANFLANKMAATEYLYSLDNLLEYYFPNLTEEEVSQVLYHYEMVW